MASLNEIVLIKKNLHICIEFIKRLRDAVLLLLKLTKTAGM